MLRCSPGRGERSATVMIEIAETDTIQPVLDRFMEIDTMPSVEAGRQGVRGAGRAGACALSEETRASLLGDLRR